MSGFNIEADGFETVYAGGCGGGTFDVSGTITLTPTGGGEPPAPEPPRWPDATTTGVRRSTRVVTAPVHPGDTIAGSTYTVNAANAVYEALEFHHLVVVRAPSARFVDCRFSGLDTVPPGSTALLSVRDDRPANGPVPSAIAEHCTFRPRRTGVLHDAFRGSNATLRRVDISGVVDALHLFGSTQVADPWAGNVLLEDSYLHDFQVPRDPGRPSGYAHADGVQIVGGSNIVIRGNSLGSARKASIMIVPTRNNTRDILIEGNLMGRSEAAVNANDHRAPGGVIQGLRIIDNVFERQPIAMIITRNTRDAAVITGNEWADDGSEPPVRNG